MDNERLLVTKILEQSCAYKWSLQGFGMLRLYLSKELRMHVWSKKYMTPNVTLLHNHPWDFRSKIVCGTIYNTVYYRHREIPSYMQETHIEETIVCGPGGCSKGDSQPVSLDVYRVQRFDSGEVYAQKASEIHSSDYEDGTVTLVQRTFHEDTEHAKVYYPIGEKWVSAEPREATSEEVYFVTQQALRRLKGEDDNEQPPRQSRLNLG